MGHSRITNRSLPAPRAHNSAVRTGPVHARRSSTTATPVLGMAPAPATTVAYTNDVEVLDGMLSVLDTHEFVFSRLMGLADVRVYWVTPRAGADDSPHVGNSQKAESESQRTAQRTTPLTPRHRPPHRHRRRRPRRTSCSQL
ncbi:hypothetical protein BC826DRAFT_734328 [Russula brevipes]|nr:hypothetical protein BC826DRAFT_734328 [Russula brevipes]